MHFDGARNKVPSLATGHARSAGVRGDIFVARTEQDKSRLPQRSRLFIKAPLVGAFFLSAFLTRVAAVHGFGAFLSTKVGKEQKPTKFTKVSFT
jgi:hypothetical protein